MDENEFSIRDKRDELARFVDYGVLNLKFRGETIYFKVPETEKQEKEYKSRGLIDFANKYGVDWNPFKNIEDANKCGQKLREIGGYNTVSIDYEYSKEAFNVPERINMGVVRVTFFGSSPFKSIRGEGKDKLEAICNACFEFVEREKKE